LQRLVHRSSGSKYDRRGLPQMGSPELAPVTIAWWSHHP
jgi:hypothetical protein